MKNCGSLVVPFLACMPVVANIFLHPLAVIDLAFCFVTHAHQQATDKSHRNIDATQAPEIINNTSFPLELSLIQLHSLLM
jgi:hypothetical protein